MTCGEARPAAWDALDSGASEGAAGLGDHMASCARCASYMKRARALHRAVPAAFETVEPPALDARVLARLDPGGAGARLGWAPALLCVAVSAAAVQALAAWMGLDAAAVWRAWGGLSCAHLGSMALGASGGDFAALLDGVRAAAVPGGWDLWPDSARVAPPAWVFAWSAAAFALWVETHRRLIREGSPDPGLNRT